MLIATALLLAAASAPADTCLSCHGDPALEVTLPSGETRSLFVDGAAFAGSVHGDKLVCTDCHRDIVEVPHASRPFRTRREFSVAYYEACKSCHFANYSKTLDSVHYAAIARGDRTAPLCVDCHGAHDVAAPAQPRGRISQTCAKCHEGVSNVYARSVHGKALLEQGNPDVPSCVDCHHAHDVAGPHQASWESRTPELCASCHADETRMRKYGLSAAVLRTYLADFHGMTVSLRSADAREAPVVARCTDCHGVHDITRVDAPDSPVLQANLAATCRRCHAQASERFPAAWLSHYEPSWQRAPLVHALSWFYWILIPFMIGGLVLQILLHVWRVVVNR
ncbi:MAG TPA: cytochrome c3 family protein [Candidatus Polarisedimenticolaceae bacterium]|nr:cytochrome c3 family protein [Candidatus Polarisedimenticolaceae bacterium]